MVDYTVPTGNAGSLIIRDNGSTVEYIITCSDPQTQVGSLGWNGTINGVNVGGSVSLPKGFGAARVGIWTVTTDQTVLFNMFGSGTSGLGGPTSHSAHIVRGPAATVPQQMAAPTVTAETPTGMTVSWLPYGPGGDGGSPVDFTLVRRYPTAETSDATPYVNYSYPPGILSAVITDLERGTSYWWVTYAHNVMGYSLKSPATEGRTTTGAYLSESGAWVAADVLMSDGTVWNECEVLISDGNAWKGAG